MVLMPDGVLPAPGDDAEAAALSETEPGPLDVVRVIEARQSHSRFLAEPVPASTVQFMLDAAVRAPNHKLTEPWGFIVLGHETKRRFGRWRAKRKVGGATSEKAAARRLAIVERALAVPLMIAITCRVASDKRRREEDYAATWMGVQNLLLVATAYGLAANIETGKLIERKKLRRMLGVAGDERIVALLSMGRPSRTRKPSKRAPAERKTRWLP